MTRLANPAPQHFDRLGNPLSGGKMFFYEPGSTTTLKDTFSDVNLSVENTNPVILDKSGLEPNIYLDGTYRIVLQDKNGIQRWERDNVNQGSDSPFAVWLPTISYGEGVDNIVTGSDGNYYVSLVPNNLANDPVSSPAQWQLLADYLIEQQTFLASGDIAMGGPSGGLIPLPIGPNGTRAQADDTQVGGIIWVAPSDQNVVVVERTSNTILSLSNLGNLIRVTSGTFTQTFDDAVTLGEGWFVRYVNDGTGVITLDPDGAETIDITTVYPGDQLIIVSDGVSNFYAAVTNNNSVDNKIVVTTGNGYGSTNTVIRRFTTTLEDVGTALTYADSATLGGSVTVNEPGLYEVHFTDGGAASNTAYNVGASLNSAQLTTAIESITAANRILYAVPYNTTGGVGTSGGATRVIRCDVGDVIRAHNGTSLPTSTAVAETMLSVTKVG